MKQVPQDIKRKVEDLRKKYCEGLCSEYYMRTGIPQIVNERLTQSQEDISAMMKRQEKVQKKSEKAALREYKKAHKNCKEYRLIFH